MTNRQEREREGERDRGKTEFPWRNCTTPAGTEWKM